MNNVNKKSKIVWTPATNSKGQKQKSMVQPLLLGARISPAKMTTVIDTVCVSLGGALRTEMANLVDAAKQEKNINLPIASLRAMLSFEMPGVIAMTKSLGVAKNDRYALEMYSLGSNQDTLQELKKSIHGVMSTWCMDVLLPWSTRHGLDKQALKVKKVLSVSAIELTNETRKMFPDAEGIKIDFPLAARYIADRLAGHELFPGLGPCEVIVTPEYAGNAIELMTLPHLDETSKKSARTSFSMVAKISVITLPYRDDLYLRVGVTKRVWTSRMPARSFNAPNSLGGYVVAPGKPILRVMAYQGENGWDFGDEYKQVQVHSGGALPTSLREAVVNKVPDDSGWWVGLPETTTLFSHVSQRSTFEGDEVDLFEKVMELLKPMVQPEWTDTVIHHKPPKISPSDVPMLGLSAVWSAGASLAELEGGKEADPDEGEGPEPLLQGDLKSEELVKHLQGQNVRAISLIHQDKTPILWVFGMTEREWELTERTGSTLFGNAVEMRFNPLPPGTHGLKSELPKHGEKPSVRFEARVTAWRAAAEQIAKHDGPKYVLIRAPMTVDNKTEDQVNYFAGIHAMTAIANANVHHILPLESEQDPLLLQNFLHRLQSALMDVFFAHAGVVFDAGAFVRKHYPGTPPAGVIGIQVVRSRARSYSGEKNVKFIMFSRLNCVGANGTTDVKFAYRAGKKNETTQWMPLSEGLRWLGKNRLINGDDKWLRDSFKGAVKALLGELAETDPRAIVLVDWKSTRGLWAEIADSKLVWGSAPRIDNVNLADACKAMTFVRLRAGDDTMSLRAVKRTNYTGYWEGETLQEAGQTHTEVYATTNKHMIETSVAQPETSGPKNFGHFIVSMGYRKTVQVKRGMSCYRSMPRMRKAKEERSSLYEQDYLPPSTKDAALPAAMEVTVMHTPAGVPPENIAAIVTGLRLGYAHFGDWTALPAPLFFKRKVEDYIIRYADSDLAPEQESAGVAPDAPDNSETLSVDEGGIYMKAFSNQVLRYQNETDNGQPQDAAAVDQRVCEKEVSSTAEEGAPAGETMLQKAKRLADDMVVLAKNGDPKVRRLFSTMLQRQTRVHVELPYFVTKDSLGVTIFSADSTSMRVLWKRYVAITGIHSKSQPSASKAADWVMGLLTVPQSTYVLASSEAPLKNSWRRCLENIGTRDNLTQDEIDYLVLTEWVLERADFEVLSWLIFVAAQLPGGDNAKAKTIINCIPDDFEPNTQVQAALEYFTNCVLACKRAYEQRSKVGKNFEHIVYPATIVKPPEPPKKAEKIGNEEGGGSVQPTEDESAMNAEDGHDSQTRQSQEKKEEATTCDSTALATGKSLVDAPLLEAACGVKAGADDFDEAVLLLEKCIAELKVQHAQVLADREKELARHQQLRIRKALETRALSAIDDMLERIEEMRSYSISYVDNPELAAEDIGNAIADVVAATQAAVLKQEAIMAVEEQVFGLPLLERSRKLATLMAQAAVQYESEIEALKSTLSQSNLFSVKENSKPLGDGQEIQNADNGAPAEDALTGATTQAVASQNEAGAVEDSATAKGGESAEQPVHAQPDELPAEVTDAADSLVVSNADEGIQDATDSSNGAAVVVPVEVSNADADQADPVAADSPPPVPVAREPEPRMDPEIVDTDAPHLGPAEYANKVAQKLIAKVSSTAATASPSNQSAASDTEANEEDEVEQDEEEEGELLVEQPSDDQHILPLKALIKKRRYAMAAVQLDAVNLLESNHAFAPHHVVLSAVLKSLQAVDCDFEVVSRLDERLVMVLEQQPESSMAKVDQQALALGVLAAGLVNMIFDDRGSASTRWHVLDRVQHQFGGLIGMQKLIAGIHELNNTAIPITREMVLKARIGDGHSAVQEAARMRERAKNWSTDKNIHTSWSHHGFRAMHEAMFKPDFYIGRCVALIAKGDTKELREAYGYARKWFDKPNQTINDLMARTKELKRPDGAFRRNMLENVEETKKFIDEYLRIADSGSSQSLKSKGKVDEMLNDIYAGMVEAIGAIEDLSFESALCCTYQHCAVAMINGVINLFNDVTPAMSEPREQQLLLIGIPMDRNMQPSMYGVAEGVPVVPACDPVSVLEELSRLADCDYDKDGVVYVEMLNEAARTHLSMHRILPARMIKEYLGNKAHDGLAIEEQHRKSRVKLLQDLQEARQRVTTAMLLQSMQQSEASELLRKIEDIRMACDPVSGFGIGDTRCVSIAYPDFPQAFSALRLSVLDVLTARLEKTKESLLQRLAACAEKHADKPTYATHAARVRKMIDHGGVSSLRAANEIIELLDAGKMPHIEDKKITPARAFKDFVADLHKYAGGSNSQIEALQAALKCDPKPSDPKWLQKLDSDARQEAVRFIDHWIELCKAKDINRLEEPLRNFFYAIGIPDPTCMPQSAASKRLHFTLPEQSFIGLKNIFVPPELGSQVKHIQGWILPNKTVEQDFNAVIEEKAKGTPTFVMGRSIFKLPARVKLGKNAKALIIDDNLVAYMAVHPEDRVSRMLEIALLSFHAAPYGDYSHPVPPEMFFGRQKELSELRNLNGSGVLFGGRRLGKSSLLDQIVRDARAQETAIKAGKGEVPIMVTLDTQVDPAGYGADYLSFTWQTIYQAIIDHRFLPKPKTDPKTEKDIRNWLEREINAGNALTSACYLLIDEADAVMARGLTDATRFIDGLQGVCDRVRSKCAIRFVITGLHNLKRMTTQYNTAFGKTTPIVLEPFTKTEDIREGFNLITKPLGALGFHFDDDCQDLPLRIMAVCNFYPAFIQLYCRSLLESLYNRRQNGEKEIRIEEKDLDIVESKEAFLTDLQEMFELNLNLDKRYKAIALILAEGYYQCESNELAGMEVEGLRELCQVAADKHFASTGPGAMEALLDEMVSLTVLDKSGSKYRLRTPHIAIMLGDLPRVQQQLEELKMEPPTETRVPGESRIEMKQEKNSILFPMPSAWTRNQFSKGASDLIIMIGNLQCGLNEISGKTVKGEWKIGQDVIYEQRSLGSADSARTHLARLPIAPNTKRFIAISPTAWKLNDLQAYMEMAAMMGERATESSSVRLILLTTPDIAWELAQRPQLLESQGRGGVDLVQIPEWNDDALFYRLGDDQITLRDSTEARKVILDASCGFTNWIEKYCRNGLNAEKAKALLGQTIDKLRLADKARKGMTAFYSQIGLPASLDVALLTKAEEVLNGAENSSLEDLADIAPAYGVPLALIRYFRWMGLIQPDVAGNVKVPRLYSELLKDQA